jgi:hypothetical protein
MNAILKGKNEIMKQIQSDSFGRNFWIGILEVSGLIKMEKIMAYIYASVFILLTLIFLPPLVLIKAPFIVLCAFFLTSDKIIFRIGSSLLGFLIACHGNLILCLFCSFIMACIYSLNIIVRSHQ